MIYTKPIIGKMGIRSGVSKSMVFGICADTAKECRSVLIKRIGFYDSLKYRFVNSQWTKSDIEPKKETTWKTIYKKESK